ncbi:MAG TPA: hypothetical protein VHA52_10900, partial [Candidatus Babeliaceae bacterium]|nr:hypothetical protein [Candidatus Babeliaceae bacterium]
MSFKDFALIFPFIFFLLGYALVAYLIATPVMVVPSLIGHSIVDAVQLFSHRHIPLTIVAEKEDNDLLPGTILYQIPA